MWQLCSTLRRHVAQVVGQAVESCEVLQQGEIFMISFMLVGLRLLGLVSLVVSAGDLLVFQDKRLLGHPNIERPVRCCFLFIYAFLGGILSLEKWPHVITF